MKRVICLGNPFVETDRAGPLVFGNLTARRLPSDVSVIDGGLAGLDLLRFFPGCRRLVLVDSLIDQAAGTGWLVLLSLEEAAGLAPETYGHGSGLPYLLKMLPIALDSELPEITVLGLRPPYSRQRIEIAADRCLNILTPPGGENISVNGSQGETANVFSR